MDKDFLSEGGMTPAEQHGAVMRASAVPVSEMEGYYPYYKTSGKSADMLSKVLFESRMRREMPEMKGDA
jgi:hypothetical protein